MVSVGVRIYPEHVQSLRRAKQALEGERAICERWAYPTIELALAIDDLAELIDKAEAPEHHEQPPSVFESDWVGRQPRNRRRPW